MEAPSSHTTNCLVLTIGTSGGPLVMRLYFLHRCHRVWLSSFLETVGFPLKNFLFFPFSLILDCGDVHVGHYRPQYVPTMKSSSPFWSVVPNKSTTFLGCLMLSYGIPIPSSSPCSTRNGKHHLAGVPCFIDALQLKIGLKPCNLCNKNLH